MPSKTIKTNQKESRGGEKKHIQHGLIKPVRIIDEMQRSYLDYAMSVIISRALPDVRDGLKPVHRRILFAMKQMGLTHKSSYKKSARVVGEVLGKFHPHGDQAVYQTMVRLAQNFSMRYPLIDGQGNFGSIDGDSAAAMRYTEAKLAKISDELLINIDKNTVNFSDNFDGSYKEPDILPAKLPNLLLMGSDGIAVGMATKIPPHNLNDLCQTIKYFVDNLKISIPEAKHINAEKLEDESPTKLSGEISTDIEITELAKILKGPDFPTGGIIYDAQEIEKLYTTGKASIINRGVATIKETKQNRYQIIITELPYQVNKARLITKMAELVKKKRLEGISDIRDESDRKGMTIAIDLKRDAKPKSTLNKLYKFTSLQTNFPANVVALTSKGTPQLLNLKQIITEYVKHRQIVIIRRCQFELKEAKFRAHILEGLLKALDHIDEIIETIKKSKDSNDAKQNLIKQFDLTQIQSEAILEMQLRRLAALERKKIEDEYKELLQKIKNLTFTLNKPQKILSIIKQDLEELQERYGDKRRTKIIKSRVGEFSEEDIIPNTPTLVTLTSTGYIKRMPEGTFRSQHRGGKGVSGMKIKESDRIRLISKANTHDQLLIFTNKGRVFSLKVWELPEGSRISKGQAIINLINTDQDETVQSILPLNAESKKIHDSYLLFATIRGVVKRTLLAEYANIKSNGLIAIKLAKGDNLAWVKQTTGDNNVMLISKQGKSIRFTENNIRPTHRDTTGVMGIRLKKDDYIIGVEKLSNSTKDEGSKKTQKTFLDLLIVTEKGFGKRTSLSEYPVQKRGGMGLKVSQVTPKTGLLATVSIVNQDISRLIISTKQGQTIKLPLKNIPRLKRPTQGVILIRLAKKNDSVTTMACT